MESNENSVRMYIQFVLACLLTQIRLLARDAANLVRSLPKISSCCSHIYMKSYRVARCCKISRAGIQEIKISVVLSEVEGSKHSCSTSVTSITQQDLIQGFMLKTKMHAFIYSKYAFLVYYDKINLTDMTLVIQYRQIKIDAVLSINHFFFKNLDLNFYSRTAMYNQS